MRTLRMDDEDRLLLPTSTFHLSTSTSTLKLVHPIPIYHIPPLRSFLSILWLHFTLSNNKLVGNGIHRI